MDAIGESLDPEPERDEPSESSIGEAARVSADTESYQCDETDHSPSSWASVTCDDDKGNMGHSKEQVAEPTVEQTAAEMVREYGKSDGKGDG